MDTIETTEIQSVTGYKSFDKEMKGMNGFQYEVGKTYTMESDKIELCKSGFHFCISPFHVPTYGRNNFAVIKAKGKIVHGAMYSVCSQITIVKLITLDEFSKLPPIVRLSDGREYYNNDKNNNLHREDGPAIERTDGTKVWYINGKLHRTDGPAIEWKSGTKEWFLNGKRHRTNGPAVERANGVKQWYLNGKKYTENEYAESVLRASFAEKN